MNDLSKQSIAEALESKWNELEGLGSRKRILPSHPLKLYVMRTQTRNRVFRFESNHDFREFKQIRFKSLDFHIDETGDSLSVELTDEGYASTFSAFLYDLITKTAVMCKDAAAHHLITRLQDWSKLFARGAKIGLSDAEALGLRGELGLVNELLRRTDSKTELIESWRGPNGDKSDVGWGYFRIEIKTKRATSKGVVQISSAEQLSENPGNLYLYVSYLNSGASDGQSINDLVQKVYHELGNDLSLRQSFDSKLLMANYLVSDPACDVLYQEVSTDAYSVVDGFPRLTSESLPTGISKIVYDVDLSSLSKYKIELNTLWTTLGLSE